MFKTDQLFLLNTDQLVTAGQKWVSEALIPEESSSREGDKKQHEDGVKGLKNDLFTVL